MKNTKQQWFKDAKYGLFIHWGLYSLLGGEYNGQKTDRIAEWIMNYLNISPEDYSKLAQEFNPTFFNADEIVKKAKEWGMNYIVFTSKHHEGFAMYHSACDPYNVVDATPCKRDILKELQVACEKYDMKLGLYYSQAQDWYDPDGFQYTKDNSGKKFQEYLERKCLPQIKEILTEYGEIALIWFDTPMDTTKEQSSEIVNLVKTLQPNCLISGRVGNDLGDYMTTGDNFIPRLPYEGDWEVPATLNDTWGFNKDDDNWKSAEEIIQLLVKINSRGGNYLLNIGPDGLGRIPDKSVEILDRVGKYVRENKESIFGTIRVNPYSYELDWGIFTQKAHKLFVHVFKPRVRIELLNVVNKVKGAYLVKNGQQLEVQALQTCEGTGIVEVNLPKGMHTDSYYSICIDLEEEEPIFEEIK